MPSEAELIQAMLKGIRDKAVSEGGGYVPYSQMVQPTKTLIESMPQTKGGICRALACKWIVEHANDGSLFNWLFAKGTTNVKQSSIANLMMNFVDGVATSGKLQNTSVKNPTGLGGGNYQDLVMDKYFAQYRIVRRALQQGMVSDLRRKGHGLDIVYSMTARMTPKWMNTRSGCYVHIYIGDFQSDGRTKSTGAHSMAAWVGQDIAFFDPNFGEFYFTEHAKFEKWFVDMWQKSGYINMFDAFKLDCFAKKVGR